MPAGRTVRSFAALVAAASALLGPGVLAPPAWAAPDGVRIDAGGSRSSLVGGAVWLADRSAQGGSTSAVGTRVQGTSTPSLYGTTREGMSGYDIPVSNGSYTVTVKMVESSFTAPGQRVFDISVEDATVEKGLDLVRAAGGTHRALDRSFPATVTDGRLDVDFRSVVGRASVAAIEVVPVREPTTGARPAPDGVPSAETTGVPVGTALTSSGSITVTRDGTVLDALDVTGTIEVNASNVTIRRTRITNTGTYPIRMGSGFVNLVVEDTEIDGRSRGGAAVVHANYTLRRVNIHHVTEGPRLSGNNVVEDSYIHHLVRCPETSFSQGCHVDALQSTGGTNITVRGNNIQAYNPDTKDPLNAVFMFGEEQKPLRGCLVEDNVLNGGMVSVNGGGGGTRGAHCTFRGNKVGRDFRYAATKYLGPNVSWDASNVWFDTGQPAR